MALELLMRASEMFVFERTVEASRFFDEEEKACSQVDNRSVVTCPVAVRRETSCQLSLHQIRARTRLTGGGRSRSEGESSEQLSSGLGALRLYLLLLRGSSSSSSSWYGSGGSHVALKLQGGTRAEQRRKREEVKEERSLTVRGLLSTIDDECEVGSSASS